MDRKRHLIPIIAIVLLSCTVQLVRIHHATVPALDAVGFVEIARRIESQGLLQTIRHEREQPLFPAWVWLVHEGIESTLGEFRSSWAASAQLAAAIPLVLAVVPVYLLSVRLVGPTAGLAGSLLFCLLPEVSRLGADGISDSTHLLLFCLALWATVMYLTGSRDRRERGQGAGFRVQGSGFSGQGSEIRIQESGTRAQDAPLPCPAASTRGHPLWLFVVGMAAASAVLVRTEALILPAALVAALVAFQCRPKWRQPWRRFVAAAGLLALGCGLALAPYLIAAGAITPRAAVTRILGRHEPQEDRQHPSAPATAGKAAVAGIWASAGEEPMSFAPKETTTSLRRRGYLAAAGQFAGELAEAFGYLAGVLALVGLWRLRGVPARPADRFMQIYVLLFALAVFHFAAKEGYLSARHLLTLVVVATGWVGLGAIEVGRWMSDGRRLLLRAKVQSAGRARGDASGAPMAWAVVLLAAAVCLSQMLKPLHASRLGHRRAAQWLASRADAPGRVLDTRGWTGLYSGRPTYRYQEAQTAFADPQLAYVVVESRELEYPSARSRTLRHLLRLAAEPVATFPEPQDARAARKTVVVYRWRPVRFSQWLATRATPHRA